jgi:hypothetical protein
VDFCNAICIFGYCNVWAFGVVGRTRIIVSEVGLLSLCNIPGRFRKMMKGSAFG